MGRKARRSTSRLERSTLADSSGSNGKTFSSPFDCGLHALTDRAHRA
jgi:hypothetical protein